MVNYCVVVGCTSTCGKDSVSFFRLPAIITNQCAKTQDLSERRRRLWLSRICRTLKTSSLKYIRVCSRHFVKEKPSPLFMEDDIDWAPSINLGHSKLAQIAKSSSERRERNKERRERQINFEAAETLLTLRQPEIDEIEDDTELEVEPEIEANIASGSSTQTDMTSGILSCMEKELNRLTSENLTLKQELSSTVISEESFRNDDAKVKMLTGLPSFRIMMIFVSFIEPALNWTSKSSLTKFQQIMLVLIRLKLNFPVQYVASIFKVSPSTVSKIFLHTLNVMYVRLMPLIHWPSREELHLTMPMEFRKYFGLKVSVIIDCFEIFIERPSNLKARAQTWSLYKHHNTCKYLIGITPQGSISFISRGYGGRATDKFITNDCGILDKLVYGDVILADRGFDIAENVAQVSCELKIPAFTKGRSQLSALDVEQTRKIAHVRIHVERVIGLVRNKFRMLHDTAPVDYMIARDGSVPTMDKIVTVCCALTNLCKSVVPFE